MLSGWWLQDGCSPTLRWMQGSRSPGAGRIVLMQSMCSVLATPCRALTWWLLGLSQSCSRVRCSACLLLQEQSISSTSSSRPGTVHTALDDHAICELYHSCVTGT